MGDSQILNDNLYPELRARNRLQTTCNQTICDPVPVPVPLTTAPVEEVKNGGGWACVVISTVLSAFNPRPASPKTSTSLSNKVMMSGQTREYQSKTQQGWQVIRGKKNRASSNHVRHVDIP